MYKKLIYWTPRIVGLLFVGFLSLFSFDVFGNYHGLSLLIAFLMHMLPSFVLLLIAITAWKYGLVGAVSFIAFATLYALEVPNHPEWIIIISGPAFIVGVLYFWDWYLKREVKRKKNFKRG